MAKARSDGHADIDPADDHHASDEHHASDDVLGAAGEENNDVVAAAATVGVVVIGAAIFEAALLPGVVLGVAAVLAPKYLPKLGAAFNPLFKTTVRGAYKLGEKTREMVAEMQEQVHDIVAEVNAEGEVKSANGKQPTGSAPPPHA